MRIKKKHFRQARTWLDVSIVGIQFPVAIVIGFFFGQWLDKLFGTRPWMTAIFSLFGIAAGFVNLFRITAAASRAEAAEARRQAEEADGDEGGDGDREPG